MERESEPNPSRAMRAAPHARRVLVLVLSVVALQLAGAGRSATAPSRPSATENGSLMLDAFLLRPLGFGATVVGFGFFLVAGPFTAPAGQLRETWDFFVMSPYEFTFRRPLGDLEDL